MLGSLKMVKPVGAKNHKIWKFKKLGYKFICPLSSSKVVVPPIVEQLNNWQDQQMNEQATHNDDNVNESTLDKPQEIALRRSAISDDYVVYLQET